MRLSCDVEVRNRCLPSFNLSKNNRPSRCRLMLTRKGQIVTLVISTLRESCAHSYKVNGNIEAVFSKFVKMGKCTLRFLQPTDDVSISNADPLQLRSFLQLLQLVLSGKEVERVPVTAVAPLKAAKKNMTLISRREHLMVDSFPMSITTLTMGGCEMRRLDTRVLALRNLTMLSLTRNRLTALPEVLGQLHALVELDVSHNELTAFPPALLRPPVVTNLRNIDLSNNQIARLPEGLDAMTSLYRLRMVECGLEQVPHSIGKLGSCLRKLDLAINLLESLPLSILNLRLHTIDVSGNPLPCPTYEELTAVPARMPVPSLVELAARQVANSKMELSPEEVPATLIDYVKTAKLCECGGHCFEVARRVTCTVPLSQLAHTYARLPGQSDRCPLQTTVCSLRCHRRFYNSLISRNPRC